MVRRVVVGFFLLMCAFPNNLVAQWADPSLVASQVGFGIATSFLGKLLIARKPAGHAFKEALVEGSAWGMVAHTGYYITGRNPKLALVGKTIAQKSTLMGHRSIRGEPVFDESLYSHWTLTHSFVYLEFRGKKPRVELDVLNAGFSIYYLLADDFAFDAGRTLYGGSLVFRKTVPDRYVRGFYVPGVIWIDGSDIHDETVFTHELIHSLQAERGSTFKDWHYKNFRFNLLAFANGAPALLEGWPDHDKRPHEREANLYAGR